MRFMIRAAKPVKRAKIELFIQSVFTHTKYQGGIFGAEKTFGVKKKQKIEDGDVDNDNLKFVTHFSEYGRMRQAKRPSSLERQLKTL